MGFWFFLSVLVGCRFLYKSYKLRLQNSVKSPSSSQFYQLDRELSELKRLVRDGHEQRLAQLEEQVLFGDYELKRKFASLENEVAQKRT